MTEERDYDQEEQSGDRTEELLAQLEKLTRTVESLKGENSALRQQIDAKTSELTSEDYIDYLTAKKAKGRKESRREADEDIDLDLASGSTIARHVLERVEEMVKERVEALKQEQEILKRQIGYEFANVDFKVNTLKYPELAEKWESDESFQQQFYRIAKENPRWDTERVYKEIRREQREAEEAAREASRRKAQEERKASSERGGPPSGTTSKKVMSLDQAIEEAAKEVLQAPDGERELRGQL